MLKEKQKVPFRLALPQTMRPRWCSVAPGLLARAMIDQGDGELADSFDGGADGRSLR